MLTYDPPSGWRYGFPRLYKPLAGETLAETLIRDGYPSRLAEFGAKHCGFGGTDKEIEEFIAALPPSPPASEE